MAARSVRFIHASDLHLERAPQGLTEIPDALRDTLTDCPYRAAQRVFDAAVAERVDFLILSGDVLHVESCGPRGPLFLCDQFARLAQHGIAVYWAGGSVDDPESWPAELPLAENVFVFPRHQVGRRIHHRDGQPMAQLVGQSHSPQRSIWPADFSIDHAAHAAVPVTIAVGYGAIDVQSSRRQDVCYWALGGRHAAETQWFAQSVVHYPGTSQGRDPKELGPHGCSLVEIAEGCSPRIRDISADVVRWQSEHLDVSSATTRHELEQRIQARVDQWRASQNVPLLVRWTVTGAMPPLTSSGRGVLAHELLDWLRRNSAAASPVLWSTDVRIEPPAAWPAVWYEGESILADFLREVRRCQEDPSVPLGVDTLLDDQHIAPSLEALVARVDDRRRKQILRETAALGVELCGALEPMP